MDPDHREWILSDLLEEAGDHLVVQVVGDGVGVVAVVRVDQVLAEGRLPGSIKIDSVPPPFGLESRSNSEK